MCSGGIRGISRGVDHFRKPNHPEEHLICSLSSAPILETHHAQAWGILMSSLGSLGSAGCQECAAMPTCV